jgi:lysophospholipase L1-like esterase
MTNLQRISCAIRNHPSSPNRRYELLEARHYLSPLPMTGNPATANAVFIDAVYQDVLGRQADAAGLAWGTALVNSGQPRGNFIAQVVYSGEASTDFVRSVYQQYLGRAADTAGLNYWAQEMQAGVQNDEVKAAFVASDEFYARAGGTQSDWIQAAYETVLGRSAEPEAVTWAMSQLQTGQSRYGLAFMLVAGTEGLTDSVERDLSQFQIPIDQATVSSLVSQLANEQITEQDICISYLSSAQYFDLHTGVPVTTVPVPNVIPWIQSTVTNIADQSAMGDANVVFVGDSITQLWATTGLSEWNQYFAPLHSLNAGVSGDTTQSLLWRLDNGNLNGISPKLAVLMIGTNNLVNSASDIAAGITAVVQKLQSEFAGIRILLLGILPAGQPAADSPEQQLVAQVNSLVTPLADGQHLWFLDLDSDFLNSDGSMNLSLYDDNLVHPNAAGFQVLAHIIAPWVQVLS